MVSILCFMEDAQKAGGAYVTVTGRAKKMDIPGQTLTLESGELLHFGDIYAVM